MSGTLIYIHDNSLNILTTLPSSLAGSIVNEIEMQNSNNPNELKYFVVSTEFPPIGKKFIDGKWIEMTNQEKINAGVL